MSILKYNDITLPYSNVTRFSQDAVYDEQGNTDWYCTRFDIQVTCYINLQYIEMLNPRFATVNAVSGAAAVMKAIRQDLLQPRKRLSFVSNGVDLIPSPQENPNGSPVVRGVIDAKNGPQPQYCTIDPVTDHTFILQFGIIAHYWETNTNTITSSGVSTVNLRGCPVLYNRWSETVEIDNCQYSKRTREGKYIIRSDNYEGKTVDQYRAQLAVLMVPKGFLRESARYTVSPDGLALQYTIVDKEHYKLPPEFAYEAHGEYTGTSANGGGSLTGEVRLRLRGGRNPRFGNQDDLVTIAVVLCTAKLMTTANGPVQIRTFRIKTDMFDNAVDLYMCAMMNVINSQVNGVANLTSTYNDNFLNNITFTPLVDDSPVGEDPPTYTARGSARLLLQAAAYYDPNLANVPDLKPGKVSVSFDEDVPTIGSQQNTGKRVPGEAGRYGEDS